MNKESRNKILTLINTLIYSMKFTKAMNVHISERGSKLLNDSHLAAAVLDRIIIDHKKLDVGEHVTVKDTFSNKVIEVSSVIPKIEEAKTDK